MLVETRTAIRAVALVMGLPNGNQQFLLLLSASARKPLLPVCVAALGHLHRPTQSRDRMLLLVLLDELVSHCGRTVKIPTAFFSISFSSLRRAFSRLSWANSRSCGLPCPGNGRSGVVSRRFFHL